MSEEPAAAIGDNQRDEMREELFKDAAIIGKHSGPGDTPICKLGMLVVKGACGGLIEPTDAKSLYQEYAAASKNAGGTPGSIKTNASKLGKVIEFGCLLKRDGEQIAVDAMCLRKSIQKAKPPFDGLVDVARLCLKLQRKPTDDEIIAALSKPAPRAKAVADEWQAVAKTVGKLLAVKNDAAIETARAIRDQLNIYIVEGGEEITAAQAA